VKRTAYIKVCFDTKRQPFCFAVGVSLVFSPPNVEGGRFWLIANTTIIAYPPLERYIIHRVRKKRPRYSRHNFDKFRRSFAIFGMNNPEDSFD